jgi:anti-sigma regulatory factor (Ser/Thr protein kinase)
MDKILFQSYTIDDRSQVSYIKREIHSLVKVDFGPNRTAEIDIVVSEILSNIIKHAQRGEFLCRLSRKKGEPFFEVICIDNGPGMKDVTHSSRDGVSTRNTLGQGLGAISRLSNFSQVYSQPGWGTIVYANFLESRLATREAEKVIVRCINVAKPGETVSGDGADIRILEDKVMIFAGDGLGHGPHAKDAVDKARLVFKKTPSADPSEVIRQMNDEVKKSRGLVGVVAVLDTANKKWEICGVGNIYTRLQKGLEYRNYIGNNGIISLNISSRLQNTVWEMEKFQLLIFCSDGINTRWDLVRYPSILKYDPIIIAAALYKDHARKTDDMTILIVKVA